MSGALAAGRKRLDLLDVAVALRASEDLGLLFHLGRSGDPVLREIGQEAGRRRLERRPDDAVTRFHLAVSFARSGAGEKARPTVVSRS